MKVMCYKCLHIHSVQDREQVDYLTKYKISQENKRSACLKCGKFTFVKLGGIMNKSIHDLELHETTTAVAGFIVVRVPGGWIYTSSHGVVFVEYNNEFIGAAKVESDSWRRS